VGLVTAITRAYQHLSFGQILARKWSNLVTPFEHEWTEVKYTVLLATHLWSSGGGNATRNMAVEQLREQSFLYLLPTLGLLAVGPIAYAITVWRRDRQEEGVRLATSIWLLLLASIVFWALALFGPAATINQQGSYVLELLAFAAALISIWRLSHVLAAVVMSVQIIIDLLVYVVLNPRLPFMVPLPTPVNLAELGLAGVGVAVTVLAVIWAPRRPKLLPGGRLDRAGVTTPALARS
jgi:hypothetical protein